MRKVSLPDDNTAGFRRSGAGRRVDPRQRDKEGGKKKKNEDENEGECERWCVGSTGGLGSAWSRDE